MAKQPEKIDPQVKDTLTGPSALTGMIVRMGLSSLGGFLIGKGYMDAETFAQASGAVVTLGALGWSYVNKKKQAKKLG